MYVEPCNGKCFLERGDNPTGSERGDSLLRFVKASRDATDPDYFFPKFLSEEDY